MKSIKKSALRRAVERAYRLLRHVAGIDRREARARIGVALARGAATAPLRTPHPADPLSWEFSAFSQHGEDGILDYLTRKLLRPNRFFFEIGAASGVENCTAWLAYARNYAGVWVEGDAFASRVSQAVVRDWNWAVHSVCRLVQPGNVTRLMALCPFKEPDVFSLDIDSFDYYIAETILEQGLRPKIWVVEYNSVFGPERAVTIPLAATISRFDAHPSGLYYGCAVGAWRKLFAHYGYTFVTVDGSGTNAFFVDPAQFPSGFAEGLRGLRFRDNEGDLNGATRPRANIAGVIEMPRRDWCAQSAEIDHLPLVDVEHRLLERAERVAG
jgi:hypothetical protein